jgi:AraC-like DNA-binding protein
MHYHLLSLEGFPLIEHFVHDIYEITNGKEEFIYTTVPNGIIGISLLLKGESSCFVNGCWEKSEPTGIYGMIKQPKLVKIGPGLREIAIGFKPYILKAMVGESIAALAGGVRNSAIDFFKKGVIQQLYDELAVAHSDKAIKQAVQGFLEKCIDPTSIDPRMKMVNHLISEGIQKVDDIAYQLNLSTTALRNLSKEHMGLSPKELIKLYRIKKALNFHVDGEESLTSLSYELGYFDQSHFVHQFKETIGLPPKKYFQNEQLTFDFYNFKRWQGDSFGLLNKP